MNALQLIGLLLLGLAPASWGASPADTVKCGDIDKGALVPSQPVLLNASYAENSSIVQLSVQSSQATGYSGPVATRVLVASSPAINQEQACGQLWNATQDGYCNTVALSNGKAQLAWDTSKTGYAFISQGYCLGTAQEYWTPWRSQANGVPLRVGSRSVEEPVQALVMENGAVVLEYTVTKGTAPALAFIDESGNAVHKTTVSSTYATLQAAILGGNVDFAQVASTAPVWIAHFEESTGEMTRRVRSLLRMPVPTQAGQSVNWRVQLTEGATTRETQFTMRAEPSVALRGGLFRSLDRYQNLAAGGVLFASKQDDASPSYAPLWAMMLLRSGLGPDRYADIQARLAYNWGGGFNISSKSGAERRKLMLDVGLQIAIEALPVRVAFLQENELSASVGQGIKTYLGSPGRMYYSLLTPGRQLLVQAQPIETASLANLQWDALNGAVVRSYDPISAMDLSLGLELNSKGSFLQASQPGTYELRAQLLPRFFHTPTMEMNAGLGAYGKARVTVLQKAVIGTELADGKHYPAQFVFKPGSSKKFLLPSVERWFRSDLIWSFNSALRAYPSSSALPYSSTEPSCASVLQGSIVQEKDAVYLQVNALAALDNQKMCRIFLEQRTKDDDLKTSMAFDLVVSDVLLKTDVVENKGKCVDADQPNAECKGSLGAQVLMHPALMNAGYVEMELQKDVIKVVGKNNKDVFAPTDGQGVKSLPKDGALRKKYTCSNGACGNLVGDIDGAAYVVTNTGGGGVAFRYYGGGDRKQGLIEERLTVNGYWLDWNMATEGSWDAAYEGKAPGYIFSEDYVDLTLKVKPDNLNVNEVDVFVSYPAEFAKRFTLRQVKKNGDVADAPLANSINLDNAYRNGENFTIRYTLSSDGNGEPAPFSVPLIVAMKDHVTRKAIQSDTLYVTNAKCPSQGDVTIAGITLAMDWGDKASGMGVPDWNGFCEASGTATLTLEELKKHLPDVVTIDGSETGTDAVKVPVKAYYNALTQQWTAMTGEWKTAGTPGLAQKIKVGAFQKLSLDAAKIEITTERKIFSITSNLTGAAAAEKEVDHGDGFVSKLTLADFKGTVDIDLLGKTAQINDIGYPKLSTDFRYNKKTLIQLNNAQNSVQPSADLSPKGVLSGSYVAVDPAFSISGELRGTIIEVSPIGFSWDLLHNSYSMVNRGYVKLSRKLENTVTMEKINILVNKKITRDVEFEPGEELCSIDFYMESNGVGLTTRVAMQSCMFKPGLFFKDASAKMEISKMQDLLNGSGADGYSLEGGLLFFANFPKDKATTKKAYKYSELDNVSFFFVDKLSLSIKGTSIQKFALKNAQGKVNLSKTAGSLDAQLKDFLYENNGEEWDLSLDSMLVNYEAPKGLKTLGIDAVNMRLAKLDMDNGKLISAKGGVITKSGNRELAKLSLDYAQNPAVANSWSLFGAYKSTTGASGFGENGLFRKLLPINFELFMLLGNTGQSTTGFDAYGINAKAVLPKGAVPIATTGIFVNGAGLGFCNNCYQPSAGKDTLILDPNTASLMVSMKFLIGGVDPTIAGGLDVDGSLKFSEGSVAGSQDCKGKTKQASLRIAYAMPKAAGSQFLTASGTINADFNGAQTIACMDGDAKVRVMAPARVTEDMTKWLSSKGYKVSLWDLSAAAEFKMKISNSGTGSSVSAVLKKSATNQAEYGTFFSLTKTGSDGLPSQSFITKLSSRGNPEFGGEVQSKGFKFLVDGNLYLQSTGKIRIGAIPAGVTKVNCVNLKNKSVSSGLYGMLDFEGTQAMSSKVDAFVPMDGQSSFNLNAFAVNGAIHAAVDATGALYINALGWDACKDQLFTGSVNAKIGADAKTNAAKSTVDGRFYVSGDVSIKAEGFFNSDVNKSFYLGVTN